MSPILSDQMETAHFLLTPHSGCNSSLKQVPVPIPRVLSGLEHAEEAKFSPELVLDPWTF